MLDTKLCFAHVDQIGDVHVGDVAAGRRRALSLPVAVATSDIGSASARTAHVAPVAPSP